MNKTKTLIDQINKKSTICLCDYCKCVSNHKLFKIRTKSTAGQILCIGDNIHLFSSFPNIDIDWNKPEVCTIGFCDSCAGLSLWIENKMVYPEAISVVPPNEDLSEDIKNDYIEAAHILRKSPRGAAALLRLAIQKLCKQVEAKGNNINNQIADLVAKGLPKKIQQALDTVRVIGNEAVHPGVLDLKDDVETATKLFKLVNLIADNFIADAKEVDDLFNALPSKAKEAIEKRDAAIKN